MGFAICAAAYSVGLATPSATRVALGGGIIKLAASSGNAAAPIGVAGTLSKLTININSTGTSRSIASHKNGSAGSQSVSIGNGASGFLRDATNTDTVAAGDRFDSVITEAGTDPTVYSVSMLFSASANHAAVYCAGQDLSFATASTTQVFALGGYTAVVTAGNQAQVQWRVRAPGTLRRFFAIVDTNARVTTTILGPRVNGSNGAASVSIGSGATGLFEDPTNTDAIAGGDLINGRITTSTGTQTINFNVIGATFENTTGHSNDVFGGLATGSTRGSSATVHYFPIAGRGPAGLNTTVESQAQLRHDFNGEISNARINITANSALASQTMRIRKNGADGNSILTITNGVSGWFEDTTNTDSFSSGDLINFSIVGGTANAITARHWGVTERDTDAVVGGQAQPYIKRLGGVPFMARNQGVW